jgi:hypothetical protein
MCRYATTSYKPHFACFKCKKTYKRKLLWDILRDNKTSVAAKCPQCGELMANMGLDFEAPKKNNVKAWKHIEDLYVVGITFHSCGCTGPGYIPKNKEMLVEYFNGIISNYHQQLNFWRNRTTPLNDSQKQREISLFWNYISKIPQTLRPKKGEISSEAAKLFWLEKIQEVEQKIQLIHQSK